MPSTDADSLIARAMRAHERKPGALYPSQGECTIETVAGKRYVFVRNTHEILSVYKVRGDGRLEAVPDDEVGELLTRVNA